MNMLKRSLAMILTVCMLLSVLPFGAMAEEFALPEVKETEPQVEATETEAPAAAETEAAEIGGEAEVVDAAVSQRILHLDCGRKYFTADWIKALITEMKAAGFTHLQLAFGNDGLRFLLDDMSVGSYTDSAVTAAIQNGNKAYNTKKSYSTTDNELTQAEMDEIIAHAKTVGIEIIPLLNNPGHMYTLISAMTELGMTPSYNGSSSTIDMEDTAAVTFLKELLQKYVTYFASKGSTIFNIGADEYANDIYSTGGMGFGNLVEQGKYQIFVDYVNELNAMVKAAGMKTMVFNDGIYFQNQTSYAFDTDIMVAFWTSGWGSGTGASGAYKSASASTMATKGHPMINVNGDYYYILGVNDCFTSGTSTSHANQDYTAAEGFSNTTFMGSTVSNPVGSMFCIWCDVPGAETETEVAKYVRPILRVMGARMQDSNDYEVESIVAGGFNADGTINVTSTEPETPTVSAIPNAPATMVVGETATLTLTESATWASSDDSIISVASVSRDVTGTEVQITANAEGKATITATGDSGTEYSSEIAVTAAEGGEDEDTGDTTTLPDDYKGTVGTSTTEAESYWQLVTNGYSGIESGKKYLIASGNSGSVRLLSRTGGRSGSITVSNSQIASAGTDYQFTLEGSGTSWTIKDSNGTYLYPNATYNSTRRTWSYALAKESSSATASTFS